MASDSRKQPPTTMYAFDPQVDNENRMEMLKTNLDYAIETKANAQYIHNAKKLTHPSAMHIAHTVSGHTIYSIRLLLIGHIKNGQTLRPASHGLGAFDECDLNKLTTLFACRHFFRFDCFALDFYCFSFDACVQMNYEVSFTFGLACIVSCGWNADDWENECCSTINWKKFSPKASEILWIHSKIPFYL